MSHAERTGVRDLAYSSWHRRNRVSRFMSWDSATKLSVIDIDWCEYCNQCYAPLALIETQESEHKPKRASVTQKLARLAGICAYSVSYSVDGSGDIRLFQVQQISPSVMDVIRMTPENYAEFLLRLRDAHSCEDHGTARQS